MGNLSRLSNCTTRNGHVTNDVCYVVSQPWQGIAYGTHEGLDSGEWDGWYTQNTGSLSSPLHKSWWLMMPNLDRPDGNLLSHRQDRWAALRSATDSVMAVVPWVATLSDGPKGKSSPTEVARYDTVILLFRLWSRPSYSVNEDPGRLEAPWGIYYLLVSKECAACTFWWTPEPSQH